MGQEGPVVQEAPVGQEDLEDLGDRVDLVDQRQNVQAVPGVQVDREVLEGLADRPLSGLEVQEDLVVRVDLVDQEGLGDRVVLVGRGERPLHAQERQQDLHDQRRSQGNLVVLVGQVDLGGPEVPVGQVDQVDQEALEALADQPPLDQGRQQGQRDRHLNQGVPEVLVAQVAPGVQEAQADPEGRAALVDQEDQEVQVGQEDQQLQEPMFQRDLRSRPRIHQESLAVPGGLVVLEVPVAPQGLVDQVDLAGLGDRVDLGDQQRSHQELPPSLPSQRRGLENLVDQEGLEVPEALAGQVDLVDQVAREVPGVLGDRGVQEGLPDPQRNARESQGVQEAQVDLEDLGVPVDQEGLQLSDQASQVDLGGLVVLADQEVRVDPEGQVDLVGQRPPNQGYQPNGRSRPEGQVNPEDQEGPEVLADLEGLVGLAVPEDLGDLAAAGERQHRVQVPAYAVWFHMAKT